MSLLPRLGSSRQLSRWDPLNDRGSFYDLFSDFFNGMRAMPNGSHWSPAVDIVENEKAITLTMDVPGMERKDLKVEIDDGALVIRGERKHEKEGKEDNVVFCERSYGSFLRSFRLPDDVDQKHIKAECKNGILRIELHKEPSKKKAVKSIEVT